MNVILCFLLLNQGLLASAEADQETLAIEEHYSRVVQPLLANYCYDCHAGKGAEGDIDLSTFAATDEWDRDHSEWVKPLDAVKGGMMPPPEAAQPTLDERKAIVEWINRLLAKKAATNAGDPGPVVVRRLNNVEYTNTVRELTGIASLDPAREFPPEGAAGEGFMNVGSALSMSPAMANKYYDAAKEIAKHAVFTPTGMRFSTGESRRDHTDEYIQKIREFYSRYAEEDTKGLATSPQAAHKTRAGIVPLERYVAATLSEREALIAGEKSIEEVAAANNLNAKYLAALWGQFASPQSEDNVLFADATELWKSATANDARAVADRIRAWQKVVWRFNPIGRIGQINAPKQWQEPVTPIVDRHELRLPLPSTIAAEEYLTVYLSAASPSAAPASVEWQRPRLVRAGRPDILLRDAWRLDELYTQERATIFSKTSAYLHAADEASGFEGADSGAVAERLSLSPIALAAWCDLLGATPGVGPYMGDLIPTRIEMISTFGFVKGWVTPDGASVLANSSDETAHTPATYPPRSVVVHPSPSRKVLVVWKCLSSGPVRVSAVVQDSHPGCGNGVLWSLELRRGKTKQVLWSGVTNGDAIETLNYPQELPMREGDCLALAIAPRDGDHACDSTNIRFDVESAGRRWNLTDEVVPNILSENPRSDSFGNQAVWHFTTEATDDRSLAPISPDSILARWQMSSDPREKSRLAAELETLLSAESPPEGDDPNQQLRKALRDEEEPLLTSLLARAIPVAAQRGAGSESSLAIDPALFGQTPDGEKLDPDSLGGATDLPLAVRLPTTVAAGSQFAVEGVLPEASANKIVQFRVQSSQPEPAASFPESPFVARAASESRQELERMCTEFRELFPIALCYLQLVPVDEVITMLLYYREDETLCRLMLEQSEKEELDRLWDELFYVSREPEESLVAFEQLLEYATQIEPERIKNISPLRPTLDQRIENFRVRQRDGAAAQLEAVISWISQAYRRELTAEEINRLQRLHQELLAEEVEHEEALRLLMAQALTSPKFLYRIETPPPEGASGPVNDWELASRLSYFLWASPPDEELRQTAAAGTLHQPEVLLAETRRMLADDRIRNLAVEFGCQWLNVHNFAKLDEKNERLYPTFPELREAMYEESIRFFADLFQRDRSMLELLDADYAFLNQDLAQHYGIPGVEGPEWRRVEGVQQFGRGGILGLGSVLAKQSGASRTSPVLRGNWLTSVVLNDPLPPPPKDVPPLDDEIPQGLTERQITERHARDPACMTCHSRVDPFGFALENYDAIGRLRQVDAAGLPIDSKSTLPDGTAIEGLDSLRDYLLTERRDEFVRQFCRKLLGYALGRQVLLSDEPLLTSMADALKENDYKATIAVEMIVASRQFREVRGADSKSDSAISQR